MTSLPAYAGARRLIGRLLAWGTFFDANGGGGGVVVSATDAADRVQARRHETMVARDIDSGVEPAKHRRCPGFPIREPPPM